MTNACVIVNSVSDGYLALVEVIDDLLVQLVFELTLSGRLVSVSLRQVGGTRIFRPLTKKIKKIIITLFKYTALTCYSDLNLDLNFTVRSNLNIYIT